MNVSLKPLKDVRVVWNSDLLTSLHTLKCFILREFRFYVLALPAFIYVQRKDEAQRQYTEGVSKMSNSLEGFIVVVHITFEDMVNVFDP